MSPLKRTIIKISCILSCLSFLCLAANSQSFSKINSGEIVTDIGYSQGCVWGDYNNDGNLDLFVTNGWGTDNNLLYYNNGDGTFSKVTNGAIVNDGGNSFGCTWGDYDNDGYIDLFVANVNSENNFLYHNNGDGTFEKITTGDMVSDNGWSFGCAWGDYDNDGYLDLFVANYQDQKNFLYHNSGDGTFVKINSGEIATDSGSSQGCAWADYDNDGYLDLFVVNKGKNLLYHNNQNGTFTKITTGDIVEDNENSFGCSWGDYDNDGYLDLFVANWAGTNSLYKNKGDGTFLKITSGEIVKDHSNSEGSSWGDYDNDGYLDIYVTNDGDNSLYKNNGDGTFHKIQDINIVADGANSNGATWIDFDNDGDLDLFIANGGNQSNLLYMNSGNSNNWINIKCVGLNSNASAIGTRVLLKVQRCDGAKWLMQEISAQTGGGYGGQNSMNLEFGLGEAVSVDSIVVKWLSGKVCNFANVSANVFLTISESCTMSVDTALGVSISDYKFQLLQYSANPFFEYTHFNFTIETKSRVSLKIYDINGRMIKKIIDEEIDACKYRVRINYDGLKSDGIYYYVLSFGETSIIKKIFFLR